VSLLISVRVSPNSSRRRIVKASDGTLKVYLNSPAHEGRANQELLKFISKKIGVARSSLKIKRGFKGREKTLLVKGFKASDSKNLIDKLLS
jgi:uncharacterized protein (TIGR00251 family)